MRLVALVKSLAGFPLLLATATTCLALAGAEADSAPTFFPEDFEAREAAARDFRQKYHEGILITGTPAYLATVASALEKIEAIDSRNWYFIRKHIRRITETGHIGMDVSRGRFTSKLPSGEIEALASQLVHDAWHRELFMADKPWEGREAEVLCMEQQNGFLARANRPLVDIEAALGTGYWLVDYWSRDW